MNLLYFTSHVDVLNRHVKPLMLKKHPHVVRAVHQLTQYTNGNCRKKNGNVRLSEDAYAVQQHAKITLCSIRVSVNRMNIIDALQWNEEQNLTISAVVVFFIVLALFSLKMFP